MLKMEVLIMKDDDFGDDDSGDDIGDDGDF